MQPKLFSLYPSFFPPKVHQGVENNITIFLLVLLWFPLLINSASAEATPVAVVQMVSASPTVRHKGMKKFVPLHVRNPLFIGDIVRTGLKDKASLLFNDGSQIRLNVDTCIEITDPTATRKGHYSLFRAMSGEIWAKLRPGNAIQAPHAIAGVRGTEFDIKIKRGQSTTLTVIEGEVEFYNKSHSKSVKRSQQSVASDEAPPSGPVDIADPEFITEWTADVDRAVLTREKFFISLDREALRTELRRHHAAVRANRSDAAARLNYADALFDSGRYNQAIQQYRTANTLKARQSKTFVHLGDALLEVGEFSQAEASYNAALKSPRSQLGEQGVAALVGMAWIQLGRERPAAAELTAKKALDEVKKLRLSVGPTETIKTEANIALGVALLRQTGKPDAAQKVMESIVAATPNRLQYQAHAWQTMIWMGHHNSNVALKEARKAVALAPDSALAHGNLALVLFYRNEMLEASHEAERAMELNKDSVVALVVRGQVLLAEGKTKEAGHIASHAVALDQKMAQAHYLLGLVDEKRKDYIHAERSLQTALALSPHCRLAQNALQRVKSQMYLRGATK